MIVTLCSSEAESVASWAHACCFSMWTPGEAEAILARSQATAEGIRMVSESFKTEGSTEVSHFSGKFLQVRKILTALFPLD